MKLVKAPSEANPHVKLLQTSLWIPCAVRTRMCHLMLVGLNFFGHLGLKFDFTVTISHHRVLITEFANSIPCAQFLNGDFSRKMALFLVVSLLRNWKCEIVIEKPHPGYPQFEIVTVKSNLRRLSLCVDSSKNVLKVDFSVPTSHTQLLITRHHY